MAPIMQRITALTISLVWCAAVYANETALPSLGDASSRIVSPELERQIGGAFLKQIHATMPTSNDPLIKYFVAKQIADLAQYSELKEALLSAVVIDDPNINAFAAPGGVVGVNLGLFLYAEDIHEYASVMAHELAHLSQRHFARGIEEQQAQSIPMLASMLASIIVAIVGGSDAGLAAMSTHPGCRTGESAALQPGTRAGSRPCGIEYPGTRRPGSRRHVAYV